MIIVLFGLTGAGKTFVGKILKNQFGFHFYEGDKNITPEMEQRLKEKKLFTPSIRRRFFGDLMTTISALERKHKNIAISQMFIKEKYRKEFLKRFPNALFVHIIVKTPIREQRLIKRPVLNDIIFFRAMEKEFDSPKIKHVVLENNQDGDKKIKEQLENLLLKQKINK